MIFMASTCPYGDQKDLHFGNWRNKPEARCIGKGFSFQLWIILGVRITIDFFEESVCVRYCTFWFYTFLYQYMIDSSSRRQVTRNRFYLEYPPTSINQSMTTCMNQVRN